MKLKQIATTAFVGLVVISVLTAGTTTVSAAPTELKSTGKVKVTEGDGGTGGEIKPIDPENPDNKLPGVDPDTPTIDGNGESGPLMVRYVSKLEFGEIATASKDINKYAAPLSFNSGANKRGAFVEWTDLRAGATYGYEVKAKMTKQFTSSGTGTPTLTGATIDYTNPMLVAEGGNGNTKPSSVLGAKKLAFGTEETFVTADKTKQEGKGTWILEFGQSKDSTGDESTATESKSVMLTVPSHVASSMVKGDYEAEILWTISAI